MTISATEPRAALSVAPMTIRPATDLRSTAVAPEWRGHRVAKQLVERIIAEAESRGIHALYLLTTTAEHYFPSFGFQPTRRDAVPDSVQATGEFQGACPASAIVMCLSLPIAR